MSGKEKKDRLSLKELFTAPGRRMMLAFALEGVLFQFAMSVKGFGNNLFATNLGATDTQLGLMQTVGCIVTLIMLVPVGVISDMRKSAKTVPIALLLMCGAAFMLQAMVPMMGAVRVVLFFVFMGLASGLFGSYNSQWQAMFGDLVDAGERNEVYALRNRIMAVVGVIVPMLCGLAMTRTTGRESRLGVLSAFFFTAGALMIVQALVVKRIPGGMRTREQLEAMEHFSLKKVGEAIADAAKNKQFMSFVFAALLLYTCYQMDWSTWYIAQTQYCMMTDTHMSFYTALTCLGQIISMGFWAKLNQKKSAHFTICIGAGSLVFSPVVMQIIVSFPVDIRPIAFMSICIFQNMVECSIMLCMVQLLLEVVPVRHRSLTVSLYTMMVTISNSIFPLLGVRLYTALGADLAALRIYYVILGLWRAAITVFFVFRYFRMKREGRIIIHKPAPENQ